MVQFFIKVGKVEVADTYIDLDKKELGDELKDFASRTATLATFQFVAESVATKEAVVQQAVHVCYGRNHDCCTIVGVDLGFYPKTAQNLIELRNELVIWFREVLACAVYRVDLIDDYFTSLPAGTVMIVQGVSSGSKW